MYKLPGKVIWESLLQLWTLQMLSSAPNIHGVLMWSVLWRSYSGERIGPIKNLTNSGKQQYLRKPQAMLKCLLLCIRAGGSLLHKGSEFDFLMSLSSDEQKSTQRRVNLKGDRNFITSYVKCRAFLCTSENTAFISLKVVIIQAEPLSQ